jgi:SAM-dependent methyltransferase
VRLSRSRKSREHSGHSTVAARYVENEPPPAGGGLEGFETPEAHRINRARLEHLASLGLPLERRSVLDVGSGPGHLAQFFVERGCRVLSTDSRTENVERLRELYPAHEAEKLDVEYDPIEPLGNFDVIFCYGLLYHLENPALALRKLTGACDELLLLETMVCDSPLPILRLEDEYLSLNQAMRGIAHRPSPAWVAMVFDRIGMHNVYLAAEPPAHPDYQFDWKDDLATERDGHLLRAIFVASRAPVDNDRLVPLVKAS